ncbi:hypothetical protein [Mycobacterium lehmannii]|uniref:hypothetical protein n=1 Tax=Mycobacterium lehmannii TaxID=2048550 RepID=UPI0010566B6C|nr:hypothetical protein [Mycobacterium lehmannii]
MDESVADDVGGTIGIALEAVRLGGNCEVELISAAADIANTFLDAMPSFDVRRFLYELCQLRAHEVEAAMKYIDWVRDDGPKDPVWDWSDALAG